MAAELAGSLAVGCSCPVCGSAEHPAPAVSATGGQPSRRGGRAGPLRDGRLRAPQRRASWSPRCGPSSRARTAPQRRSPVARWRSVRRPAWQTLAESTAATEALATLREELAAHEAEAAELGAHRAALEARLAEHRRTHEQSGQRVATRLAAELDDPGRATRRAPRSRRWSRHHAETVRTPRDRPRGDHRPRARRPRRRAGPRLGVAGGDRGGLRRASTRRWPRCCRATRPLAAPPTLEKRRADRAAAAAVLAEGDVVAALAAARPTLPALPARRSGRARSSATPSTRRTGRPPVA